MNDYEMMNQKIDQLHEELSLLQREEDWVRAKKAAVMAELLDTRRQITRADKMTTLTTKEQLRIHTHGCETWLGLACDCGRG